MISVEHTNLRLFLPKIRFYRRTRCLDGEKMARMAVTLKQVGRDTVTSLLVGRGPEDVKGTASKVPPVPRIRQAEVGTLCPPRNPCGVIGQVHVMASEKAAWNAAVRATVGLIVAPPSPPNALGRRLAVRRRVADGVADAGSGL